MLHGAVNGQLAVSWLQAHHTLRVKLLRRAPEWPDVARQRSQQLQQQLQHQDRRVDEVRCDLVFSDGKVSRRLSLLRN